MSDWIKDEEPTRLVVAFTGSRKGMTPSQLDKVHDFLVENEDKIRRLHHGDCIGADSDFHSLCRLLGILHKVEVHPSTAKTRAYNKGAAIYHEPLDPLVRDKVMVEACNILIATPHTTHEILRSGTWATIRHARKLERRIELYVPALL